MKVTNSLNRFSDVRAAAPDSLDPSNQAAKEVGRPVSEDDVGRGEVRRPHQRATVGSQ